MRFFLFSIGMLFISMISASQSILLGTYWEHGNELKVNADGSFVYGEHFDAMWVRVFYGTWRQNAKHIYFYKSSPPKQDCYEFIIEGEEMTFDSTLRNQKRLDVFVIFEGDTSRFTGCKIISQNGEHVVGINEGVTLEENAAEVSLEWLGQHVRYVLKDTQKYNSYKLYACDGFRDNIPIMKKLPFKRLRYSKGKLFNSKHTFLKNSD